MQTAVLAAVVHAGGPAVVDVDGWMCGRTEHGLLVRVVFLRFADPAGRPTDPPIPVIFENGRMVAFGWDLIRRQPRRYGPPIMEEPSDWRAPEGWIEVR